MINNKELNSKNLKGKKTKTKTNQKNPQDLDGN